MRGRDADWQEYTSRLPTADMVDAITAAGFDGIYLDRQGYADRTVESDIQTHLGGAAPMVSADGRLVFFDLRPHRAELEATLGTDGLAMLGQETLHRPRVEYRDGFAPRTFGVPDVEHGARQHNTLALVNDTDTPYEGQLTFSVNSYSPGDHQLTVRTPDGVDHTVTISPDGNAYTVPITVPPGESTVTMTTDAPEVPVGYRNLAFNLTNAFVTVRPGGWRPFRRRRASSSHRLAAAGRGTATLNPRKRWRRRRVRAADTARRHRSCTRCSPAALRPANRVCTKGRVDTPTFTGCADGGAPTARGPRAVRTARSERSTEWRVGRRSVQGRRRRRPHGRHRAPRRRHRRSGGADIAVLGARFRRRRANSRAQAGGGPGGGTATLDPRKRWRRRRGSRPVFRCRSARPGREAPRLGETGFLSSADPAQCPFRRFDRRAPAVRSAGPATGPPLGGPEHHAARRGADEGPRPAPPQGRAGQRQRGIGGEVVEQPAQVAPLHAVRAVRPRPAAHPERPDRLVEGDAVPVAQDLDVTVDVEQGGVVVAERAGLAQGVGPEQHHGRLPEGRRADGDHALERDPAVDQSRQPGQAAAGDHHPALGVDDVPPGRHHAGAGMGVEGIGLVGKAVRVEQVVGAEDLHVAPGGLGHDPVPVADRPEVADVAADPDARIGGVGGGDLVGPVRRGVVNHDQLPIVGSLRQHRLDGVGDEPFGPVRRDADAHERTPLACPPGSRSHDRALRHHRHPARRGCFVDATAGIAFGRGRRGGRRRDNRCPR